MVDDNELAMESISRMGVDWEDGDALKWGFLTEGLCVLSSFLVLGSGSFGICRFALCSRY